MRMEINVVNFGCQPIARKENIGHFLFFDGTYDYEDGPINFYFSSSSGY